MNGGLLDPAAQATTTVALEQHRETAAVRAILAMAVGGFAIGTGEFVIMGLLPEVANGLSVTLSLIHI